VVSFTLTLFGRTFDFLFINVLYLLFSTVQRLSCDTVGSLWPLCDLWPMLKVFSVYQHLNFPIKGFSRLFTLCSRCLSVQQVLLFKGEADRETKDHSKVLLFPVFFSKGQNVMFLPPFSQLKYLFFYTFLLCNALIMMFTEIQYCISVYVYSVIFWRARNCHRRIATNRIVSVGRCQFHDGNLIMAIWLVEIWTFRLLLYCRWKFGFHSPKHCTPSTNFKQLLHNTQAVRYHVLANISNWKESSRQKKLQKEMMIENFGLSSYILSSLGEIYS